MLIGVYEEKGYRIGDPAGCCASTGLANEGIPSRGNNRGLDRKVPAVFLQPGCHGGGKHLTRTCWTSPTIDNVTAGAWWVNSPSDLIDRLNARKCEACGDTAGPFEMHHLRRPEDLRSGSLMAWRRSGWRRKTIALCPSCRATVSGREHSRMEIRVH